VGTTFGGTETGPQEWEQKERASDGMDETRGEQNVTKLLAGWTVRHTGMLKTGDGRSKGKACYIGPDRGVDSGQVSADPSDRVR